MGNLKSREFYPDFHVNIRKDGRVNGVEPITLKGMGLPYDLDYPEQPVGELSKELYENLVEEFIFLIDELLPRDIQDLFYKATLDPRRAYWKLFEEAARRMQLPYYLNCHRDEAKGNYPNISAGIESFVQEGRSLADIYLNSCVTKEMVSDAIDSVYFLVDSVEDYMEDSRMNPLFAVEAALFRMSKYTYKLREKLADGAGIADLVLYNKENKPELIVMRKIVEPDYDEVWDGDVDLNADYNEELKKRYEDRLRNLAQVEAYCEKSHVSCLKLSSYEATWLYENEALGNLIRDAIKDPEYAKEYSFRSDDEDTDLLGDEDVNNKSNNPEVYRFEGTLKKLRIESDNVCYGPAPMPDDETQQHLTINADGGVWLSRYSFDNGIIEKTNFKINADIAKKLLYAFEKRFSADNVIDFVTDIGSWDMILTNDEGKEFHFSGPLTEHAGTVLIGLSDMLRNVTGRDDLFAFDGCPDRIDNLKIEYTRETKIKPKVMPEGSKHDYMKWDYSETLTIDRATETLVNHIQFAEQCSVTNTYHVEAGISDLLDELWPEMFDEVTGNPPDVLADPKEQRRYKITVLTKHGEEKVIEGTFDKLGLPDEYPEFIEKIYDFIAFYGIGELFEQNVYGRPKRRKSDYIFCDVEFEPGGKTYCYLAEDDSYEVGDTVLVPAGPDNHEALVCIVDKNYYSKEDAPFPVEKAKWIIKRIDEDEIDEYLNKD